MSVKSIAGRLGERRVRFASSSRRWSVSDFVALTKPRVMMLAIFTALVGMSCAPGRLDRVTTVAAVLAIAAGAGAAGVLNMWYDADIDALMSRTAMRPVPRGKISRFEALAFGLVLGGFAVAGLALATNLTAAALLACTILFYIVVYTAWLKRATRQNIVIGGAAGALPPVIGWAAASGEIGIEPLAVPSLRQLPRLRNRHQRAARHLPGFAPPIDEIFRPEDQDVRSREADVVPESGGGYEQMDHAVAVGVPLRDAAVDRLTGPRAPRLDDRVALQGRGDAERVPGTGRIPGG